MLVALHLDCGLRIGRGGGRVRLELLRAKLQLVRPRARLRKKRVRVKGALQLLMNRYG